MMSPDQVRTQRPLSRELRRVVDYMQRRVGQPISIADLAEHGGIAERTLHKNFRKFLGIAPLGYLRRLRLEAARQYLLAATHGVSVTQVALSCGFTHLGRFSGQYRRAFGEHPSRTLRDARAAVGVRSGAGRVAAPFVLKPFHGNQVPAFLTDRRPEPPRPRHTQPRDLDAHRLTMRALPYVLASRADAARRAIDLLHRAIEIDPDQDLAISLAAWCHGQLVMYNGSEKPDEDRRLALQLARRAAHLGGDGPLTLTARSAVYIMAREFEIADVVLSRALALDSISAWTWGRSGWIHSYRGNCDLAVEHFARAMALDPSSPSNASNMVGIASACFGAGRYEAAVFWIRRALCQDPHLSWANRTLAVSYARLGQSLEAHEALDALRRYCPDLTVGQVVAALPFGPAYLERLGEGLSGLGLPS
jgi:AraC-like DNA-binding protein/Tfp pilus assembly protein PilF